MYYRIILLTVFLIFSFSGFSQKDTLRKLDTSDSLFIAIQKRQDSKHVHKPKVATLLSAALPGAGQVYNKKYWKVPVIYTGFASFGYFWAMNNDLYQYYKDLYDDAVAPYREEGTAIPQGLQVTVNGKFASLAQIQEGRDYHRRWRDLNAMFIGGWYLLNIVDANVDAHFYDFDVSDDLSIHWEPRLQPSFAGFSVVGASFSLHF